MPPLEYQQELRHEGWSRLNSYEPMTNAEKELYDRVCIKRSIPAAPKTDRKSKRCKEGRPNIPKMDLSAPLPAAVLEASPTAAADATTTVVAPTTVPTAVGTPDEQVSALCHNDESMFGALEMASGVVQAFLQCSVLSYPAGLARQVHAPVVSSAGSEDERAEVAFGDEAFCAVDTGTPQSGVKSRTKTVLRRSARLAARCPPRRSARLAAKARVNYRV